MILSHDLMKIVIWWMYMGKRWHSRHSPSSALFVQWHFDTEPLKKWWTFLEHTVILWHTNCWKLWMTYSSVASPICQDSGGAEWKNLSRFLPFLPGFPSFSWFFPLFFGKFFTFRSGIMPPRAPKGYATGDISNFYSKYTTLQLVMHMCLREDNRVHFTHRLLYCTGCIKKKWTVWKMTLN